ncbi:unnamed protein product [Linum trigynum]|uniref:Post-GPI attachment to proteins factor 3 n=1 Tax=Linum trigynum TaxID=586398 RepID=A0AAV2GTP3_9ROSI
MSPRSEPPSISMEGLGTSNRRRTGTGRAAGDEIYDFPPYKGYFDAHSIWHATTIPLTYVWWSFVRDDVELTTSNLFKKSK